MSPDHQLARDVLSLLERHHDRIVCAESCTAGLVSATLAAIPGASKFLCGSAVVYRNATKTNWLHVPAELLDDRLAVMSVTRLLCGWQWVSSQPLPKRQSPFRSPATWARTLLKGSMESPSLAGPGERTPHEPRVRRHVDPTDEPGSCSPHEVELRVAPPTGGDATSAANGDRLLHPVAWASAHVVSRPKMAGLPATYPAFRFRRERAFSMVRCGGGMTSSGWGSSGSTTCSSGLPWRLLPQRHERQRVRHERLLDPLAQGSSQHDCSRITSPM